MPRVLIGSIAALVVCSAIVSCSVTSHRSVPGANGQTNVKIKCKERMRIRCTQRAEEVCGSYTMVEPMHLDPDDGTKATMTVHCNPLPPLPTKAELMGAAGAPGSASPSAVPSGDAGAP
jgi:hypothetical protein